MTYIKNISLALLCLASFSPALVASLLVLPANEDNICSTQSTTLQKVPEADQELARHLYDIVQSLLSSLEDDHEVNQEFLNLLQQDQELGDFSNWMNSKTIHVSKEKKVQNTIIVLANIKHNQQVIQKYEDWVIGYLEQEYSAEMLFEAVMRDYLSTSRNRVNGLLQGEAIPPTLEKHLENLDQYGQALAQQSINTHTLLYLLLETLYDAIEVKNLSQGSKTLLQHMPVLNGLLEGRSVVGPNPDLSLLDGAILLSGEYASKKTMPKQVNFRSLRDNFHGTFAVLKEVTQKQIIVKGRSRTPLYTLSDFLPTYGADKSLTFLLREEKETPQTSPSSKKKDNKKRRTKAKKKVKAQPSLDQNNEQGIADSYSAQENEETRDQVEDVPVAPLTVEIVGFEEKSGSAFIGISDALGAEIPVQESLPLKNSFVVEKFIPDPRPVLHLKRRHLLNSFWEDNKLSYKDFTTLFEGFGGTINQTKGGSSHVKLSFITEAGKRLTSGTWRPHPKPILRGSSLSHLRDYFKECGFLLDNYQTTR